MYDIGHGVMIKYIGSLHEKNILEPNKAVQVDVV